MIEPLLDHPLLLRVGWTLVHTLWQGVALAILLALGLLLSRGRHELRHNIATAVLLLWLAAPVITFALLGQSEESKSRPMAGEVVETVTPDASVASSDRGPGLSPISKVDLAATPISEVGPSLEPLQRLLPYAVLAWLGLAVLFSLRLLGGLLMLRQLVRNSSPLYRLQPQLDAIARRLGIHSRVRLLTSRRVDVPTALGWLRPVVILPTSIVTGLTPNQLDLILAHELAHIRRNDYLASIFQGTAEALLFHHPLTWWLSNTLRTSREHASDDLALRATGQAPLVLAEVLARLEVTREAKRPALAATSRLGQRVRRLIGRSQRDSAVPYLTTIALAVTLLAAITYPAISQGTGEDEQDLMGSLPSYRFLTVVGTAHYDGEARVITRLEPGSIVILEVNTSDVSGKLTLTPGDNGLVCYELSQDAGLTSDCGDRSPEWFSQHLGEYFAENIVDGTVGLLNGNRGGQSLNAELSESFSFRTRDFLEREQLLLGFSPSRPHVSPEWQGAGSYRNIVEGTLWTGFHYLSHDVISRERLLDELSVLLQHDTLTPLGLARWKEAISTSRIPIIRELSGELESVWSWLDRVRSATVVLDPAHSDVFPGASSGGGLSEEWLTLEIAKKVRDRLEEHALKVLLTREDSSALGQTLQEDLQARADFATPDVSAFIILHTEASSNGSTSGIETFTMPPGPVRLLTQHISSRMLAQNVQQYLTQATKAPDRGLREQSLPTLSLAQSPAVSVNLGFLSNERDASLLADEEYRDQLATGVANGILAYLREQRVSPASGAPQPRYIIQEVPARSDANYTVTVVPPRDDREHFIQAPQGKPE